MTCEVHNKEINSQCAELLVRPLYIRLSMILGAINKLNLIVEASPSDSSISKYIYSIPGLLNYEWD